MSSSVSSILMRKLRLGFANLIAMALLGQVALGAEENSSHTLIKGISAAMWVEIIPVSKNTLKPEAINIVANGLAVNLQHGAKYLLKAGPARLGWIPETFFETTFVARREVLVSLDIKNISLQIPEAQKILKRIGDDTSYLAIIQGCDDNNDYYIACPRCSIVENSLEIPFRVSAIGRYRLWIIDPQIAKKKTFRENAEFSGYILVERKHLSGVSKLHVANSLPVKNSAQ